VITTKVKAEMLGDLDLKSIQINVETYQGVVQLSGFVQSQAMIDRAVVVTQNVAGVKSVKNDMRVR
jgi:osmotically-inducible protein OsmY